MQPRAFDISVRGLFGGPAMWLIGTFRTSRDVRLESAIGSRTDVRRRL